MGRPQLAFMIAPLWVPLIISAWTFAMGEGVPGAWALVAWFCTPFAYIGAVAVGLPAYLFFKARGWTSLVDAVAAGWVGGFVTAYTSIAATMYGQSLVAPFLYAAPFLGVCTACGALVAGTVWAIARPKGTPVFRR